MSILTLKSKKKSQNPAKAKPSVSNKQMVLQQKTAVPETAVNLNNIHPAQISHLQRTVGNQAIRRAVQRLGIQRKMTVGPVGDKYEQEADTVAKQVVSNLNNQQPEAVQRQEDEEELQMKSISSVQRQEDEEDLQMKPLLQRQDDEEELQMKSASTMDGGDLSSDIEGQIQSAKGGGRPLDSNTQSKMGRAFNADFSGVNVHTDSQSDTLNRSISARAFTTGQDIFFRSGEYSPNNSGGQELLAHELTHVVQQNGNGHQTQRKSSSNKIQRMSFEGTNWESATTAIMSSGGGGGAITIKDKGDPIVVKASEDSSGEAMLFSALFNDTMGGGENREGKWRVETPGVRLADTTESARIKAVLDELLPDNPDDPRIARSKAALTDGSPTVVYTHAQGEDFGKYLYQAKKGKKGPKLKERLKVVSQLWTSPGFMNLLGKSTAIDIFMGNQDRIFLFNPDNFMVHMGKKKNRLTLIDNIFDAPRQGGKFETKTDFDDWVAKNDYSDELKDMVHVVDDFKKDDFENLGKAAVGRILDEVRYMAGSVGEELADVMRDQMNAHFDDMVSWFATGLAGAKGGLMISVQNMEQAMEGNELDVGSKKHQILRHLKARKLYLMGASAEEAWRLSSGFVKGNVGSNRGGITLGGGRGGN